MRAYTGLPSIAYYVLGMWWWWGVVFLSPAEASFACGVLVPLRLVAGA